ncbi:SpoIIE family protein phosphatase [Candidatus Sumerlaeota bacterium]|nr:SpoIIE family protein phosphatase [Candidatus Sumerlaeota bacterium]
MPLIVSVAVSFALFPAAAALDGWAAFTACLLGALSGAVAVMLSCRCRKRLRSMNNDLCVKNEELKQQSQELEEKLTTIQVESQRTWQEQQEASQKRQHRMDSINEMLKDMLNHTDLEMESVGKLQQSLLPRKSPPFEGYHFSMLYQPSGWASGDYYDFIPVNPSTLGVVVADVSGHGGRASVVMAIIRALMQTFAKCSISPAGIMKRINLMMHKLVPTDDFVTVFYAVLDRGNNMLKYSSAGQPYALHVHAQDGEITELKDALGIPVKVMDLSDYEYEECAVELAPGDRVILFTDGVIEAMNPSRELYGIQRLIELCRSTRLWPIEDQIKWIQHNVVEFAQFKNLNDDFTIVAIERSDPDFKYDLDSVKEIYANNTEIDMELDYMDIADIPSI